MFHKICWFSNLEKYPKGCINNNCNYLHPGQESIREGKRANESVDSRGEHFPEFAKNHWGKVPNFWDLGKSSMKFNSTRVVAI